MARVSDETVARVRAHVPIVDLVAERTTLGPGGHGALVGACPMCGAGSFHVSAGRGVYYCFGCGAGGDVIKFVMDADGLPFAEAVMRLLARVDKQPGRGSADHGHG